MYFRKINPCVTRGLAMLALSAGLTGCDSSGDGDSLAIADDNKPLGEFKIAYVKRSNDGIGNPTDAGRFRAGGDLFIKDLASPAADETNITGGFTKGTGDVADPAVSYDGTRIVFSMCFDDQTWDIWEYNVETNELRPIITDDAIADQGDDHDPAYLPDGRIVFSSNRQTRSAFLQFQQGIPRPYKYRDEFQREAASVLHIMNPDGSDIRQLSFNQSHDRNPSVLRSGKIMYARWDHFGNRNHVPIYTMNPDGSDVNVLYGAFSAVNSLLHPREMRSGKIMSTAMPVADTVEGGALLEIDVNNFLEINQRAPVDASAPGFDPSSLPAEGTLGQRQVTFNEINTGKGISSGGRYSAPYPLWDGSNRALVAWSPSQPAEVLNAITGDPEMQEGTPVYGLYMLDLDNKSQLPLALPEIGSGQSIVEGVAIQPRSQADVPKVIPDPDRAGDLAERGMAILNVKSVYDTDALGSMGQGLLVGNEAIPQQPAPDGDSRVSVAAIAQLKDPTSVFRSDATQKRPARFIRVSKAVPTPSAMIKDAISANGMEMQQIVGYAAVEPDGSIKVEVPAETAIAVSVLDDRGRAIQVHTNWLNLQRGEELTCNGCHSPRRGTPINGAGVTGNHPNTTAAGLATDGETMAETRARLNPAAVQLTQDILFRDFWSDAGTPTPPEPDISIDYAQLTTPAPAAGVINYAEHIQPLWDNACVACHNAGSPAAGLDLSSTIDLSPGGNRRMASYNGLTVGEPQTDGGLPAVIQEDGNIDIERNPAIVEQGSSTDGSRASRLIELLYGEELRAAGSVAGDTIHAGLLNTSEQRLVTEWVDLGAQYVNTPFARAPDNPDGSPGELQRGTFRAPAPNLDAAAFVANIYPILTARCADCHQPRGDASELAPAAPNLGPGGYILTGDVRGDLNNTVAMIADSADPAATALLARAASDGAAGNPVHPLIFDPVAGRVPVLSADAGNDPNNSNADYQTIAGWISGARQ